MVRRARCHRVHSATVNRPTGVLKCPTHGLRQRGRWRTLARSTAGSRVGHYNYFRSYSAERGRYTQADPIGLDGGFNRFGYVEGNPLRNADPTGLWTFQVGVSLTGSGIPAPFGLGVYGQVGVGFAIDGNGNMAGYWNYGGGGALGTTGAVVGVQGIWSNGDTVCDLRGDATNFGLNAAGGWGGTVDTFGGSGSRGQPVGGVGVTVGGGAGVSGYGGVSRTGVTLFGDSQDCTCRAK
ncbi:RHS repeat-associated core domain-containing protein [Acidovorax sp.]|uniref:RHS repeat-associated core domain-containing protein n=1 Tax=Acidovorax sp. TaxID=1872122 RepID=UPI002ACDA93A|nr:RHS repeat-associated core domain-containing protein [Acidovorax sp.]MDZ7864373.1 RHS repeat-associated core domain-containing protein [Acidovorax sp.]